MSGGKGGKAQTVGYKYYVGQHLIFCHGPCDYLTRLTVDEREAWTGLAAGGTITVDKPELFGGEGREGGVSGSIDVEMGAPTQTKNAYLLARIGPNIPAYRGVVGLVFKQTYMGNNPYLKPWRGRWRRIHKREDGLTQWYDAKSEISTILLPATSASWDYQFTSNALPAPSSVPAGGWTSGGIAPFGRKGPSSSFVPPHPIQTLWAADTGIWIRNTVSCPGGVGVRITGQVENSAWIFWDGNLVGSINPDNTDTPVVLLFDITIPAGSAGAGNHELAIRCLDDFVSYGLSDNTYIYAEVSAAQAHGDMNPAHIIRECLTNPDWGMGYSEDDVDEVSFTAAADKLFAEGLGISLLWDRQTTLESFISEIVRHIDAALYVSRSTGKFVLKLTRADYDASTLIVLDESNIDKIEAPSRPAFGELVNSVSVQFWNYLTGKDDSVTVQDPAGVQMQGAVINTAVQYPGFTRTDIGARVAARDLRALSNPFLTCTVYTTEAEAEQLDIGDCFKLTWGKWYLNETIMRVTGFAMSDGKNSQIRINCVEDVFGTPLSAVVVPPSEEWVDPSGPATPAAADTAFEIPYYELVQALGQTDTDAELAAVPERGFLGAAAMRGNEASIAARLYTDSGAGYEQVDTMDLCPGGFTVADIDQMDTTFTLEDFEDLDLVTVGSHAQLGEGTNMELVRVDSINTTTGVVTCGRGVLDTTPKIHEAGTMVLFWDVYNGFDTTEYVDGETINAKVTPTSGQGQVGLDDVSPIAVTMDQRALRPYPPGKLQFDAEYYPALVPSDFTNVTWAHRDRLLQTSGALDDHTAGNIGPEVGTTYEIDVLDDGDPTVRGSYSAIALTTQNVDLGVLLTTTADVRVYSARAGLRSMQPARHVFEFTAVNQFLVYPLTYDEDGVDQDAAAAPTLARQGAGPHVTPAGFEGDGHQARYKVAAPNVPAWMTGAARRLVLHASVKPDGTPPGNGGSSGDTIVHCGADAVGGSSVPSPKLRLCVQRGSTTRPWAQQADLFLQTYDTALRDIPLARHGWKFRREFPLLEHLGHEIDPQGLIFLDNDSILVNGHRNNLESMCWVVNADTGAIEGQFSFGTVTNGHVSSWAKNAAGDLWCMEYNTNRAFKIDLAASLASGVAVILQTWTVTVLTGPSGMCFITVGGTEYVLVGEYGTSGTRYIYAYLASGMTGSATLAGRYKRFIVGTDVQGLAMKGTDLYVSRSAGIGTIDRYNNFATQMGTVADGGTPTKNVIYHAMASQTEDLDFHPVTGECWMLAEGWSSVADYDHMRSMWSSALDGAAVETHVTATYNGNGGIEIALNGRAAGTVARTPTIPVDCFCIGGPPNLAPDNANGYFNGYVRNVRFQSQPLEAADYALTVSGSFEPNVLTAYVVPIVNPGAESGTASWTNEVGAIGTKGTGPTPYAGAAYFTGGAVVQSIARQRHVLATVTGLSTAAIDAAAAAGGLWAKLRWQQAGFDTNDPATMGIRTLDGTPTQIALSYGTVDFVSYSSSGTTANWFWQRHSKAIESGARNIDALMRFDRTSGTNNDGYIDDVSMVIYKK